MRQRCVSGVNASRFDTRHWLGLFTRELLSISHNANVPVLGDADYVLKLENMPQKRGGRPCVVRCAGCFESKEITAALLELDGGRTAFEFRQHRYALPR